jgi:hypothetical protein
MPAMMIPFSPKDKVYHLWARPVKVPCPSCDEGRFTMHLEVVRGYDAHHVTEATFKALGLALRRAAEMDPRRIGPSSTKGAENLSFECSNCRGTGIDPQTDKKCEICSTEE